MKGKLTAVLIIALVVTASVLGLKVHSVSQWNQWVNQVQIVGQPGSDVQVVEQVLGSPKRVVAPDSVGTGVSPRVASVPRAETVYVYTRVFVWPPWYWVAYVFLDESGQVVKVHVGTS